jgi:hypothetical protein
MGLLYLFYICLYIFITYVHLLGIKRSDRRKKEYLIMWFLARPLITLHQKSCLFVHHRSMLRNMVRTACISTSLPKTLRKIAFLVVLKVSIEH